MRAPALLPTRSEVALLRLNRSKVALLRFGDRL
jgi:hypothetical protein